jgi:hypothetical protein
MRRAHAARLLVLRHLLPLILAFRDRLAAA